MANPIRVGVAGVGRIGQLHAGIVARQTPDAVLAAVGDSWTEGAQRVGTEFQVPVLDVDDLVTSPDIDAVAICTATPTHVDLIVRAAQAGKAIFTEKPISLELAEVDRALAAVAANDVPFMVGFNRRFDPGHAYVHDVVRAGQIGEVHMVRIASRDPSPPSIDYVRGSGGIFVDMMIHDFDLTRYLVDSPVVEVFAKGAVRIDPAIGEAGDVDTAVVMLTHANGVITTIDNSRQAVYGYDQRVEVFGSTGMALSENPRAHAGIVATETSIAGATLPHFFLERYAEAYVREWAAFIRYVREGGSSPVSGADGRAPVVLGVAAWESVRTGMPVAVTEG